MIGQPAAHADTAAEAVRSLNHATLPGAGGLTEPADVYAVLGSLSTLTARLPQALAQLHAFVEHECRAGRLRVVDGEYAGDPTAAVTACAHWTAAATASAQLLHVALSGAHNALAWIAARGCPTDD